MLTFKSGILPVDGHRRPANIPAEIRPDVSSQLLGIDRHPLRDGAIRNCGMVLRREGGPETGPQRLDGIRRVGYRSWG